jgi:hypothetical protein
MGAADSSNSLEISVPLYQTARRHIPEYSNLAGTFCLKVLKLIKFWRVDNKFKIIHFDYIIVQFIISAFACNGSGKLTPDMH